jgi:hypothetical protein
MLKLDGEPEMPLGEAEDDVPDNGGDIFS